MCPNRSWKRGRDIRVERNANLDDYCAIRGQAARAQSAIAAVEDDRFQQRTRAAEAVALATCDGARCADASTASLREYARALENSVPERRQMDDRHELVPIPCGSVNLDDRLFAARFERRAQRAALACAEAAHALARSGTPSSDALLGARDAARDSLASCERRTHEAQSDATAFQMVHQPVLTSTLKAQHRDLVRAKRPDGHALADSFNITVVRGIATVARHSKASKLAAEREQAERLCRKTARDLELKDLIRKLSPRSRLSAIVERIDALRAHGFPETAEGVEMLRALRAHKARAKEALKKQRKTAAQQLQESPPVDLKSPSGASGALTPPPLQKGPSCLGDPPAAQDTSPERGRLRAKTRR